AAPSDRRGGARDQGRAGVMPLRLWAALAGVVAVLGLLTWSHLNAYQAGRDAERVARLKADVEAYQKREGIENEVTDMDRVRICLELGGVQSDCEQLRRMAQTSSGE